MFNPLEKGNHARITSVTYPAQEPIDKRLFVSRLALLLESVLPSYDSLSTNELGVYVGEEQKVGIGMGAKKGWYHLAVTNPDDTSIVSRKELTFHYLKKPALIGMKCFHSSGTVDS